MCQQLIIFKQHLLLLYFGKLDTMNIYTVLDSDTLKHIYTRLQDILEVAILKQQPSAAAKPNWKRRNDIVTNENVSIVEKWKINFKCQTINILEFEFCVCYTYSQVEMMIKLYTHTRYVFGGSKEIHKRKNTFFFSRWLLWHMTNIRALRFSF